MKHSESTNPAANNKPQEKKSWNTPTCENLDDLKIEGGANPTALEVTTGTMS